MIQYHSLVAEIFFEENDDKERQENNQGALLDSSHFQYAILAQIKQL
jgi:hypothetical protein